MTNIEAIADHIGNCYMEDEDSDNAVLTIGDLYSAIIAYPHTEPTR